LFEPSTAKTDPARIQLMIAPGAHDSWAEDLAGLLAAWPVDVLWSRSDTEAVDMAVTGRIQVALVDASLPVDGGLEAIRRIRRLGIDLPSLLVCDDPSQRLLLDALALDVFSVVHTDMNRSLLAPMLCKIVKQVYRVEWPCSGRIN
jgi:DNA-binding NarL/FixJ family response regulator